MNQADNQLCKSTPKALQPGSDLCFPNLPLLPSQIVGTNRSNHLQSQRQHHFTGIAGTEGCELFQVDGTLGDHQRLWEATLESRANKL